MCGLRTFFLCLVFAFCLLFGVSHATNESVCVLSDAPQQCGAFCLGAVHPLCDQYAKSKQEEAIVKIIADSRAEQKELVNDMVKLTADSRTKQKETMVKLIADSQAEQKELVNRSQEEMVKMIAEFRAEQKELLNVLAANLTASRLESTLQSRPVTVPPGFQKIGSRYFFVEYNEEKSRTDAEETCREKGGQLATFGNEDEFEAVTRIVSIYSSFWLGYHRNSKDEFVTTTGNKGSFMKWHSGEPENFGEQNCVGLYNLSMYARKCDIKDGFICQLDTV
ncbi:accessory gland protein Acp29AB-like [Drosophila teissieri]|uniref:accessory gland protein Acp29AB-like n=1 Tax=Drosophila teissieri TaxID=7243 RepID=UPI001CB9E90A|nr:accessory gland protein Acp29AB-like [Drosophila teissieri]